MPSKPLGDDSQLSLPPEGNRALVTHFDERASTFDNTPWAKDERIFFSFESMIDFTVPRTILDAGGGTGLLAAHFQALHPTTVVTNVDISAQMALAAQAKGIPSLVADVCQLPFKDSCFDFVLMRQVLQYVSSPSKALSECRRVLRPGGYLLLGQFVPYDVSDQAWLKGIVEQWQPLKNILPTEQELRYLLLQAGFQSVSVEQIEVMESLSLWLDRYQVSPLRKQAAIALAMNHRVHANERRQILVVDSDVVFSNLFVLIRAYKAQPVSTPAFTHGEGRTSVEQSTADYNGATK